jgi:hypothetical protein
VIRAQLERIEPTLGPEEESYRRHFLRTDRAQATGSVLITLALVVLVFALELNFFGRQQLVPIMFDSRTTDTHG